MDEAEACRGDTAARLRSAPAALCLGPAGARSPFARASWPRCARAGRAGAPRAYAPPRLGSPRLGSPRAGHARDAPERARSAGAALGARLGAAWRHAREPERQGGAAGDPARPEPGARQSHPGPEQPGGGGSQQPLEPHRFRFGGAERARGVHGEGVPLLDRGMRPESPARQRG